MPTPENARLAVLIDADNTSRKYVQPLMEEVAKYGIPTVKRAYGDWTSNHLNGWKNELNRNAITPVQQFAYTTGKNSTDSALIIDAMDLLYTGNLDGFAIVSSDSDFTRLATRLREAGKTVYGLGQKKTPESLRQACTKFIYLEVLGEQRALRTSPRSRDPESGETPLPRPREAAQGRRRRHLAGGRLGAPRPGRQLPEQHPLVVRPAQLRLRAPDHAAPGPGLPGRRAEGGRPAGAAQGGDH